MECKVCTKDFELKSENKYLVGKKDLFKPLDIFEAFDCPYCGCQNIVNVYSVRLEDDEKSENNVND